MTPSQRVARSYMASVDAALEPEVSRAVRDHMLKYLREMKAAYRKMYNSQKVDGKVFESILENTIPNYEFLMAGGVGLDPDWVPYVGDVSFDRGDFPAVREMARQAVFDVLSELFGEVLGMSSAFRWDTETAEEFWFLTRGYDVRAANVLGKKVHAEEDGVHYTRPMAGIGMVTKVLVGNPRSVPTTNFQHPDCPMEEPRALQAHEMVDDSLSDHDMHSFCLLS